MSIDDVVTQVKALTPGEKDILVMTTGEDLSMDEKRELAQMFMDRGVKILIVVVWDQSDMMNLNEELMLQWGWVRHERLKAILENMPGREQLASVEIEHLGAGS